VEAFFLGLLPAGEADADVVSGGIDIGRQQACIGYQDSDDFAPYRVLSLPLASFPPRRSGYSLAGRTDIEQLPFNKTGGFDRRFLALRRQWRDGTDDYLHKEYLLNPAEFFAPHLEACMKKTGKNLPIIDSYGTTPVLP
jgi:hypothetical protein